MILSSSERVSTHSTNAEGILIILHFSWGISSYTFHEEFQLQRCFTQMTCEGILLRAQEQPRNPSDNLNEIPSVQYMVTWETEIQPAWNIAL